MFHIFKRILFFKKTCVSVTLTAQSNFNAKYFKTITIWNNLSDLTTCSPRVQYFFQRKLTLFGKCQIINSLIVFKLIYVATILESPDQAIIKQVNKIIFSFLWGKRERIKRKTLIRHISDGGIGITDFETKVKALKASWVSKLIQSKNDLNQLLNACI